MKFDNVFSDNVIAQVKRSSKIPSTPVKHWWQGAGRALLLSLVLWIGLFVLGIRLFTLTVIDGHRFRALADTNRTRELIRHAPRGLLLDRTGAPLVQNIPRFRLLSPCSDRPEELCVSRITEAEGKTLEEQGLPPKHFLEVEYQRKYTHPESTAHVIGYTGEINAEELDDEYYSLRKYQRGDQIGRTAAEVVYEEKLRGRNGRELVEVDAEGGILRLLGRDSELPGENITLSIDGALSDVVASSFPKNAKGAVIVSKPSTGEILALYSNPTYSLNRFTEGMTQKEYEELVNDPSRPMFDRAIGGVYPPASTYKIVTSWAALEEHTISQSTVIEDTGIITIGPFSFANWYFTKYGAKDGLVNITKAIARSNDIFFYRVGEEVGISNLEKWSQRLGIGTRLGIELPGEAEGILPSPEWKNQQFTSAEDLEARQNEWYLGDTYHMSIGQGYLLSTPLQVNTWTNALANGGKYCIPTILKVSGGKRDETKCVEVPLTEEHQHLITEGMLEACEQGGTAYPLFNFSVPDPSVAEASSSAKKRIPVACKTGTAEFGHPTNKTHAWITMFSPVPIEYLGNRAQGEDVVSGDPEISITILVEEGGEGSDTAAPIAKKILEYWYTR